MSINLVSVHRLLSSLEDGTDSTHLNSLNWKRLDNISGINSLENCLQSVLNCPCDPQPLPGLLAGHNFPGLRSNLCHLTRPLTRPRSPDGQILPGNLFSPVPRFRFRFIPPLLICYKITLTWTLTLSYVITDNTSLWYQLLCWGDKLKFSLPLHVDTTPAASLSARDPRYTSYVLWDEQSITSRPIIWRSWAAVLTRLILSTRATIKFHSTFCVSVARDPSVRKLWVPGWMMLLGDPRSAAAVVSVTGGRTESDRSLSSLWRPPPPQSSQQ